MIPYILCYSGELEIAETYMLQTREDLESWQREVQKRLDQETRYVTRVKASNSNNSSTGRQGAGSEGKGLALVGMERGHELRGFTNPVTK